MEFGENWLGRGKGALREKENEQSERLKQKSCHYYRDQVKKVFISTGGVGATVSNSVEVS